MPGNTDTLSIGLQGSPQWAASHRELQWRMAPSMRWHGLISIFYIFKRLKATTFLWYRMSCCKFTIFAWQDIARHVHVHVSITDGNARYDIQVKLNNIVQSKLTIPGGAYRACSKYIHRIFAVLWLWCGCGSIFLEDWYDSFPHSL